MGKRIAVYSTAWNAELIGGILHGMSRRAQETGNSIYIFNTYGGFHKESEYNECEYNIFRLSLLSDFDGAVIISNNIYAKEKVIELAGELKKRNIPCVSVEQEIDGTCVMGTDNYAAMSDIVEHLIVVHGCRTFNYVGGPSSNIEANQRRRAFCDTLRRHGIEPEESRIREYYFGEADGGRAYDEFAEQGIQLADAVVCANDLMALGYINKMEECGYSVPEDAIVTGFDNILRAHSNIPAIASVERCDEALGRQCIDRMLDMIDGRSYPPKESTVHRFIPNESCGCSPGRNKLKLCQKEVLDTLYRNEEVRRKINYMQTRLMTCQGFEEFGQRLCRELDDFGISNFCVMIDERQYHTEETDTSYANVAEQQLPWEYPDVMSIVTDKKNTGNFMTNLVTARLLPGNFLDDAKESHTVLFMPLHHNGRQFGYCAMEDNIRYIQNGSLYYWLSVLNTALENIRQNICIRELNNRLEHLYMYDVLTGIYNRFALQNLGAVLLKRNRKEGKRTLFLFADMDGLKKINDTYGHEVGDAAIKAMAEVLNDIHPNASFFCLRYGGDEFLMMGSCQNEEEAAQIKEQIEEKMKEYSLNSQIPEALSASIGYILTSEGEEELEMDDYVKQADNMMYKIKQEKKKGRQ